ncbi:hypothetical protein AOX55_00004754 (plasmid) [Sinorhizobium fredii CCBAU 25509]|nr:hypothetical protein AOX55_00004754 [Sinorhizobium fredii CCBAU 25509]
MGIALLAEEIVAAALSSPPSKRACFGNDATLLCDSLNRLKAEINVRLDVPFCHSVLGAGCPQRVELVPPSRQSERLQSPHLGHSG